MSKKMPKLDVGMREEALTKKQKSYKPIKLQSYEEDTKRNRRSKSG